VKYLILIYGNPQSRQVWESLPEEQRANDLQAYAALNQELAASGELITAEALADPSLTRQVLVRDGRVSTTDGPFAEVKEQLAGFYLVDCDTIERATEIAARIPEAPVSILEIRPILSYSGLEM
jgi:hypothetical protein